MKKGKKLYEGKAKILYAAPEKGTAIQHFKDDATAFNNLKKSVVEGKGVLNNRISEHILNNLNQIGIKTHLIKRLNMREQLVRLCLSGTFQGDDHRSGLLSRRHPSGCPARRRAH
mgnify:CR=1 FL=1